MSDRASRLCKEVVPSHYDLFLHPNVDDLSFKGRVAISLSVSAKQESISFNSDKLTIESYSLVDVKTQNTLSGSSLHQNVTDGVVSCKFGKPVQPGEYSLELVFSGKVSLDMRGFYLSRYVDDQGVNHKTLTTQFEPADARRAFPCFDEPAFKATFQITLVALEGATVLSNSPVYSIDRLDNKHMVYKFHPTPKMSTYLVAYVIGDFDYISTTTSTGTKVTIYCPCNKVQTATRPLSAAVKYLEFYNQLFGIPYCLPKLDLIAITDYAMGAMENWGLITFREDALLLDNTNSSYSSIVRVNVVIAHELAHQWFGNLVTMEWWTDLWLNEGFANWIEYLSCNSCYPELDVFKQFFSVETSRALALDSLLSSHPIEVEVKHAYEVDEIFDEIAYCKGGSIIQMMYNYIGHEAFFSGLRTYFKKYSYMNVETTDLWENLSLSSGKPIAELMGTFTKQVGYPVISVSHRATNNGVELHFSQRRFTLKKVEDESVWMVPITATVRIGNKSQTVSILLDKKEASYVVESPGDQNLSFVLVNPERSGFYRIRYSESLFKDLSRYISGFPVRDRLGYLTDLYAFSKCGDVSVSVYLEHLDVFNLDKDEAVWEFIGGTLKSVCSLIHDTGSSIDLTRFRSYVKNLVSPLVSAVGIFPSTNETDPKAILVKQLRANMYSLMIMAGDEQTISMFRGWLALYIKGELRVDPEYRTAMYMSGFIDDSMFKEIMDYYMQCQFTEEKVRILRSTVAIQKPDRISQIYDFCFSEHVKAQDVMTIFVALAGNDNAKEFGWNYFKTNYQKISDHFGGGSSISRILKIMFSNFYHTKFYDDAKNFFNSVDCAAFRQSLSQSLEYCQVNSAWLQREVSQLPKWLEKYA